MLRDEEEVMIVHFCGPLFFRLFFISPFSASIEYCFDFHTAPWRAKLGNKLLLWTDCKALYHTVLGRQTQPSKGSKQNAACNKVNGSGDSIETSSDLRVSRLARECDFRKCTSLRYSHIEVLVSRGVSANASENPSILSFAWTRKSFSPYIQPRSAG